MRTMLLIVFYFCGSCATAATIQVSGPLVFGPGACSIRDAIDSANINANVSDCMRVGGVSEPDTINMPAGPFNTPLLSVPPYADEDLNVDGDLDITSAIIIQGVSSTRTHLAGPDLDRLFDVRSGGSLTLRDLTLYGGSVVASNSPFGGAIRKNSGGTLIMERVLVRGGVAARGGGIYAATLSGPIRLTDVTVVDGVATQLGGGIAVESNGASAAPAELINVTISGNAAEIASGLWVTFARLSMRSSTVAFNRSTASPSSGVVYNGSPPAQPVEIINSILTDNTNSDGSSVDLTCSSGIQLALRSHTIIGSNQACTFATTTATPASSQSRLLPLFNYGGGIPVHAFRTGSAAFNSGLIGIGGCTTADARGATRFPPCDIGAYEELFDAMVDSTADLPDLDPGDGLCRAAGDVCTLRAASMEANAIGGRWFVGLPPGNYVLSRPISGADDSGGDLDIRPASVNTPPLSFTLFGLGTPANTHIVGGGVDRVLEVRARFERGSNGRFVHRYVSFALFNASVRNGRQAFDNYRPEPLLEVTGGGGISLAGGHSLIYNVVVRDNQLIAVNDPNTSWYATGAGVNVSLSPMDLSTYRYLSSARFERFALIDNLGFGDPPATNLVRGGGAYTETFAFGGGAAVANSDGAVFINGTIAGNQSSIGAGMYIQGKAEVVFTTVHDNFVANDTIAPLPSPGVYVFDEGLNSFLNTIIAGNRFGSLPRDCDSIINSLGRVLISNDTGCSVTGNTTANLINVDPLLSSRQTSTDGMIFHRLNQGSPAVDFVPFNRCTDSRGQGLRTDALDAARPATAATACDLGAIEGAALPNALFANGFEAL